jgi:hypothetical protein
MEIDLSKDQVNNATHDSNDVKQDKNFSDKTLNLI